MRFGLLLSLISTLAFGQAASLGGGSDCTANCTFTGTTTTGAISTGAITSSAGITIAGALAGGTTGNFSGALTAGSLVLSGAITGATTGAFSGRITNSVASGSVGWSLLAGARGSFNGGTDTMYVDYDSTNIAFVGAPVSAPSFVSAAGITLAGAITGATTGAFSGAINSSVASGANAITATTVGARLSLGSTSRYIKDDGANYSINGAGLDVNGNNIEIRTGGRLNCTSCSIRGTVTDGSTAVALDLISENALSTAGAILMSIKNSSTRKWSVDKDGSTLQASATLRTCAAAIEGMISVDATAGVSTAHKTRLCMCASDGAAAYTWNNVTSGTVGTTTTCSD